MIDLFGRKTALVSSIVPHFVGWSLMYWDMNFAITLCGRILTGLPSAVMFYAPQVYIVECITVNHHHLRSDFRSWPGIAFAFGELLVFVFGTIFDYRQISAIAAALAGVFFIIVYLAVPESPAWLYEQGRQGDAEISERKLRIFQPILQPSRSGLIAPPEPCERRSFTTSCKRLVALLIRPDIYKPLALTTVWAFLMEMTGGSLTALYMVNIIDSTPPGYEKNVTDISGLVAEDQSTENYSYAVVSGIIILVAHIATSALLRWGMKPLAIWSGIFMAIGMILIAFYDDKTSDLYIVHVVGVWLSTFCFQLGVFSAPICVLSDFFPNDAKGLASCVPIQMISIAQGVISKIFPFLYAEYGNFVFYQFAIITVVCTMYVYIFLPETVNNSYEKIRDNFVRE